MTSYATVNEAAVAATTATTNTTTAATAVVVTPANANHNISNMQSPPAAGATTAAFPSKLLQDDEDFDCDSLSDGREKADTTPENIKKIDDLIEQRSTSSAAAAGVAVAASAASAAFAINDVNSHHFALMSSSSPSTPPSTSTTSNPSYAAGCGVGLAAAVDESNAKFCLAKPARPLSPRYHCEKDTLLSKSERSSESKITPLTMPANFISNSSNNSSSADSDSFQNAFKTDNSDASGAADDNSSASNTTTTATTNKSYAFTIDNFNERDCDPAAAAAKYKTMLERFQNRHRRGASMSKLESDAAQMTPTLTASASASPLTLRNARNAYRSTEDGTPDKPADAAPKVKLRAPRERSTSRVRDASKRHSWSPRTSTTQEPPSAAGTYAAQNERQKAVAASASRKTAPAPPPRSKAPAAPVRAANLLANRTTSAAANGTASQFTPRSTAMQMALQKIDFLCPQPPLGDFKHLHAANSEADNISEAGTYTLDGDNYTEEQKDLMNIDCKKYGRKQQQQRPKDLNLQTNVSEAVYNAASGGGGPSKIPVNNRASASNVLEVNYYHEAVASKAIESPPQSPHSASQSAARLRSTATVSDFILGQHQSAGAYLEKIKSRVLRNMNATKNTASTAAAPLPAKATSEMSNSCAGDFSSEKMKASAADEEEPQEDMGCFTSVTTSGVLAKQSALDPRPRLTRRSSLSTSQIDSSEYISNEAKLKSSTASAYAAGGFTDHQKAEYRLNVFTNQKDSNMQKFAATRSFIESPPDTPTSSSAASGTKQQHNNQIIANMHRSDTAVLKTAQTKNDWIQEWARNARARSLAAETSSSSTSKQYHRHGGSSATAKHHEHHHQQHALPPHHHQQHRHNQDLMTRSYTCSDTGTGVDSLTDDSIYSARQQSAVAAMRLNRTLAERYRLAGDAACCDYSSDPALCTSYAKRAAAAEETAACKPPKSPSKIPSPLHSLGRARSASRTRASLQNMLPLDGGDENDESAADEDADMYLQKTAAVIQSLQESLSRKNSLKSPSTGSPRAHSARTAPLPPLLYSPSGDGSPQHSLDSPTSVGGGGGGVYQLPHHHHHQQRSPLHRRNHSNDGGYAAAAHAAREQLALMTSSINEQQLQLLTSGEYLAKQMRQRKNSFDGSGGALSPAFRRQATAPAASQTLSPLRRSSSFSAKVASTQRAARPQFQNIYTPPGARQNYVAPQRHAPAAPAAAAIKKSASSNNFRQELYGDYDDHLAYYINDEDDDNEEPYYSSGGELDTPADSDAPTVPLSNTRYNKALLMRIERSKQKVAGSAAGKAAAPPVASSRAASAAAAAGLAACPNTPELPRRNIKSAPRAGGGAHNPRQSMPRDTSLSRLATQVPSSLASAKKQLLQTAAAAPTIKSGAVTGGRIQPKYLDISKYKPVQGNSFLRKNDAKSTLKTPVGTASGSGADSAMKRSPSASSMGLSRGDPARASNRSVRSAASCMTTSGSSLVGGGGAGRTASAARRDASVAKQKEAEMAMWKRRSTYDPMKAAADDRRKKEEAKRLAHAKNDCEMSFESQQNSYEQQQWSPLDETEYGGEDDDE